MIEVIKDLMLVTNEGFQEAGKGEDLDKEVNNNKITDEEDINSEIKRDGVNFQESFDTVEF